MSRIFAFFISLTVSTSVFAQTTPLETYIYGQSQASTPYPSSLRIPAAPNTSPFSLQYIPANAFSTLAGNNTFTGANSFDGVLRINNAVSGSSGTNGNASVLITPPFGGSGASEQTVGVFVAPTLGSMTDTGAFSAAYNMAWGTAGTPIPSGTKGQLSGFECNIHTSQASVDQTDYSHCFGGTVVANGTGPLDGIDIPITWAGGNGHGINLFPMNTVSGGAQYGIWVQSTGSTAHPIVANYFSDNGGGAKMDFAAQGQSSAVENDSFAGFAGFGDSTLANPFVLIGNMNNVDGVVGTTSNHPLELLVNNTVAATFAANKNLTLAGAVTFVLESGTPATYACFTSAGLLISSAAPC